MLLRRVLHHLTAPHVASSAALWLALGATAAVGVGVVALDGLTTHGAATVERTLPPFRSVEVWDLGHVVSLNVHANLPQRVTLDAPPDARIRTEVRGDTLVISGASSGPVALSIALPELTRLVLWGDTQARVRAVRGQDLAVTLADSATIEAEGVVTRLELVADAHGRARLHALATTQARVTASGASRVDLQVRDALDATVGDHAGVTYQGNPAVRQVLHRGGTVTATRASR